MGVLIGNVARKERRDTAALWASNNPVPLAGEWCLETDTGNVKIGDGVLAWTVLSYINQIVQTFDISAGNQTMTLPKITGYPQEYNFFWTGGNGTFTATLAVTNAETVGGIAAAIWPGEGEGSGTFVSNGTNWEVKEYNDYGSNSDGEWEKLVNGALRLWAALSKNDALATAQVFNFPRASITYNPRIVVHQTGGSTSTLCKIGGNITPTTYPVIVQTESGATSTGVRPFNMQATGRWRV